MLLAHLALACALLAPMRGQAVPQTKLVASDAAGGASYGRSVAVCGDTIVVGAPQDGQDGPGAAYVLVRGGSSWIEQAILHGEDVGPDQEFARWVALDGDTLVAGARHADGVRAGTGAAYVFRRHDGAWSQIAKLVASDGEPGDQFGQTVSIRGSTILVGATHDVVAGVRSGSAYVFVETSRGWIEQAKLEPGDPGDGDWFGLPAELDGETAIVGAHRHDDLGSDSGAAYLFVRAGPTWEQQAKLLPSDGASGEWFGHRVAIDGNAAVVGARYGDGLAPGSGAAYVFTRLGQAWTESTKLVASDGSSGDWFTESVSFSHGAICIGAVFASGAAAGTGAAYVYVPTSTGWTEAMKLQATDGAPGDEFGIHTDIWGETVVVGAHFDDDAGGGSGAAYVFELPTGTARTFCYPDALGAICPCDNPGLPGRGCDVVQGTGGVLLSVGSHDPDGNGGGSVVLLGDGFPSSPAPAVVMIRSQTQQAGGLGTVFGDGLLCVAVPLTRVKAGTASLGSIALAINHGAGSGTFHYQLWCRSNPASFCDPVAAFNLSNGVSVTW